MTTLAGTRGATVWNPVVEETEQPYSTYSESSNPSMEASEFDENMPPQRSSSGRLSNFFRFFRKRRLQRTQVAGDFQFATAAQRENPFRQPFRLYILSIFAALGAFIVGMDISLVSGAQIFYNTQFGLNTNYQGLTASGTLIGALFGSILSIFANNVFGRRGTIFFASMISIGGALWEALAPSWPMLLLGRFIVGIAMGMLSCTVPVFLAETTPAYIRGALTSLYQQSVATGIFIGYVVDAIFVYVPGNIGWRVMLGSSMVPAIVEGCGIIFLPETPRWLIKKGYDEYALNVLLSLRSTREQALRDFEMVKDTVLEERQASEGKNLYLETIRVASNRRALIVGIMLQLFQQFCGMNTIMYYVDYTFHHMVGVSRRTSVIASMVAGFANAVFTIPVYWTIDSYGRRSLMLFTFPIMVAMLLVGGFSFFGSQWLNFTLVIISIAVFIAAYSPANGPVPWVVTAEIYPLYIRSECMSISTFCNYMFNFVVSFSWPDMLASMTAQGAYGFYALMTTIGFLYIFFFMPETKGYTLEQMKVVFEKSSFDIARYHWKCLTQNAKRLLCLSVEDSHITSPYDTPWPEDL
ncbi:hypothetical protein GpartN1_g2853.t1 [Galdieria partita]|uniref:Major facilitator superfamily (MFS) profile domain-containing protein n=1 Tax=Galdieria partita TaxID=83374 RepID=A0A9C7UQ07_9RHOD|nr:hypothetical protein GpartN1_g2853.t1 [Galdieria partita]